MSTDTSARASAPDRLAVRQRSDEFAGLRKTLRGLVFPMTVAFLLWYALHVILSTYARGFMGTHLVGVVNVAFVFGLSQFSATFLVAWYYSRYAESRTDPVADRIRAVMGEAAMERHVRASGDARGRRGHPDSALRPW